MDAVFSDADFNLPADDPALRERTVIPKTCLATLFKAAEDSSCQLSGGQQYELGAKGRNRVPKALLRQGIRLNGLTMDFFWRLRDAGSHTSWISV